MAAARRPSQKSCKLLQEMDNSAKELLAFLGELEDKRNTHTLEFVSSKNANDDTTRQIKDCLAERAKLYNEACGTSSSSSSSSSIPPKVVSSKYQDDIKQASSSNYQSIKSKFEQNSSSKSSSRNSSGRNSTTSSPNTTGSTSDNNSQPTSSSFGDSAISMDSDELLSLPPPPPPPENKPSAFCKPALAPKPKRVSLPNTTNACETLKPAKVITTNKTVFEVAEEVYVSKFEAGTISCSKSKAVFDNIDTLPRRRRGIKKL